MNIATLALPALLWGASGSPQVGGKPPVDWAALDKQVEALRSAVQARDIEKSQKIAQQLWHLTTQEMVKQSPTAAERLAQAEAQGARTSPLRLPYLAMQAVQAGLFDKAQSYANQALQAPAPSGFDSIHSANVVLGLVALNRDGDVAAAKQYLLLAAKTKGSTVLDRWGPNLALAKALLDRGEKQTVLEYFESCKSFVTKNPKLDTWIATLKGGGAPDLSHEFLWHQ